MVNSSGFAPVAPATGTPTRRHMARRACSPRLPKRKPKSSSIDRNAAGPRLPRRTGGIAQLVERRLCKPNVAGPSPTASTSRRSAAASQVARRSAPSQVASAERKTVSDLRLET